MESFFNTYNFDFKKQNKKEIQFDKLHKNMDKLNNIDIKP